MKTTSYEIAKNLFLVRQTVSTTAPATPVSSPTNHVAVIDCSGSMASDLPKIREQLKKKLPKLLKDGDTLSLVWFSGRGDFGVLVEAEPVPTLKDLASINSQIDRWLRPIGLTGFKEPLLEVEKLVKKVKNGNPFSLFFMSDGCDNQWSKSEILDAVTKAAGVLASSTFVEYGYYADRPMLAAMAAKAGGSLIFAESFDTYEPIFEARMACRPVGGKRREVIVNGDPIGGFVFALDTKELEITTYEVNAGKALVPEGVTEIAYLSPCIVGTIDEPLSSVAPRGNVGSSSSAHKEKPAIMGAAYAALSLFSVRMMPEVIFPMLKALGDVTFIESYVNCFGKQKYSEFMTVAKFATFDPNMRFLGGWNPNLVPPDDAFTVLDLLKMLADDDDARILLDHPEFKYSRVSRDRVDADENLSSAEGKKVEAVRTKMAGEKNAKKLKELQSEIDAILASKKDALKFVEDPAPDGYPISALTFNSTRPNVSVLLKKQGTVDISSRKIASGPIAGNVPSTIKTYIWRNYTIIRDGLINVEKMPLLISAETIKKLHTAGGLNDQQAKLALATKTRLVGGKPLHEIVGFIKPLPILNRKQVVNVSADELIRAEWKLIEAQAAQKVYNHTVKQRYPDVKVAGSGWATEYGPDAAQWLKDECGLTEYGGFSPKMVQAPVKDFYMGKELEVKIKGYADLPSVNKVLERTTTGKQLTGGAALMGAVMVAVEQMIAGSKDDANFKKWLLGKQAAATAEARMWLHKTSQMKTAILVGQVWPKDLGTLDTKTKDVKIGNTTITGTLELREIQIEI